MRTLTAAVLLFSAAPPPSSIRLSGSAVETSQYSPSGIAVMSRYWRDPAATAAAFTPDRFVRTGDLGRIDEQGRLRLAGRSKEMYVRGGYNVHPQEVEGVLAEHPSVSAVAVVARPDRVMGEVGIAFVVPPRGGTAPTLQDLRQFASARLAAYKLPEEMRVVDALPLTSMDKVDRRALARTL